MPRPFEIARESSDLAGAVAEPENSELTVNEVVEDEAVADEVADGNEQVNKDIAAVEELVDGVDELSEQVEVNEEKLEHPEEVVAADVVVSEEKLKYTMIKLGYDAGLQDRLNLSSESVVDSLRSNPARHLSIANEGAKEFISKMISTIKGLIQRIIKATQNIFAKVMFKFGNYEKKISQLQSQLASADIAGLDNLKDEDKKDFVAAFTKVLPTVAMMGKEGADSGVVEPKAATEFMQKFEQFSKTIVSQQKTQTQQANKQDVKQQGSGILAAIAAPFKGIINAVRNLGGLKTTQASNLSKYAEPGKEPAWLKDTDSYVVFAVIGNKVWCLVENEKIVDSYDLEIEWNKEFNAVWTRIKEYANDLSNELNRQMANVKNRQSFYDAYNKSQNEYLKFVSQLEKDQKIKNAADGQAVKLSINALKVGAANINLLLVKSFINNVKTAVTGANIIIQHANDKKPEADNNGGGDAGQQDQNAQANANNKKK